MKEAIKITLLVILTLLAVCKTINAKIIRVDLNPANKPEYTSLGTAYNAASAGDTLYLAGNISGYGDIIITKKIIIIGQGYFLDINAGITIQRYSSKLNNVAFNAGSEGSILMGTEVKAIQILASNIVIMRNRIYTDINAASIAIDNNTYLSNVVIKQNYIHQTISSNWAINFSDNCSNILIQNNYLQGSNVVTGGGSTVQFTIKNNVLWGAIQLYKGEMVNNIWIGSPLLSYNQSLTILNNICTNGALGQSNGNKIHADIRFIGGTSPDGSLKLKDDSPAKEAGLNGEDCGMYGGDDPYVLSGIPSIPTIYEAIVPTVGSQTGGLPVKIKAKTNK